MLSETESFLKTVEEMGAPPLHGMAPADARALLAGAMDAFDAPRRDDCSFAGIEIPGPGGTIESRLVTPAGCDDARLVIYYHGGGWVLGTAEMHEAFAAEIAHRLGLRVIIPNYRKAPEAPFPAACDDALATAFWVESGPEALGGPVPAYGVAGDSAGGNLAAVVAASDQTHPAAQLLIYPVTDLSAQSASYDTFAEGYFLERATMEHFRDLYLTDPGQRADPRVSPLLASDMSHVPPTVMINAELDVLRDEGLAYAARIRAAGQDVQTFMADGLIHGMVNFRKALPKGAAHLYRAIDAFAETFNRATVTGQAQQ